MTCKYCGISIDMKEICQSCGASFGKHMYKHPHACIEGGWPDVKWLLNTSFTQKIDESFEE